MALLTQRHQIVLLVLVEPTVNQSRRLVGCPLFVDVVGVQWLMPLRQRPVLTHCALFVPMFSVVSGRRHVMVREVWDTG